ncbi:MAG TPA: protein-methionine-sulfoxide reductase heme-binding subunit MsrQ [Gemmatimonadales bacterium]
MRQAKALVFAAALTPFLWLVRGVVSGDLGTDPVETIAQVTGVSALACLAATLAVTPLRRLTGWNAMIRLRRMLGLFAFFYALLHASDFFVFDHMLSVPSILEDVVEHPWVLFGFTALLLLVPLAVTSTSGWVRRLGGKRWQRLHRLVYVIAPLAAAHYYLAVKRDVTWPTVFAVVFAVLLLARFVGRPARALRRGPLPSSGPER